MSTETNTTPKEGALRVWHIPQLPGAAFRVDVASPREGALLLRALADYDLFQLNHNIKPDYSNVQGLEVFEDGEWSDWYDAEGNGIDDVADELLAPPKPEQKPKRARGRRGDST